MIAITVQTILLWRLTCFAIWDFYEETEQQTELCGSGQRSSVSFPYSMSESDKNVH